MHFAVLLFTDECAFESGLGGLVGRLQVIDRDLEPASSYDAKRLTPGGTQSQPVIASGSRNWAIWLNAATHVA